MVTKLSEKTIATPLARGTLDLDLPPKSEFSMLAAPDAPEA